MLKEILLCCRINNRDSKYHYLFLYISNVFLSILNTKLILLNRFTDKFNRLWV